MMGMLSVVPFYKYSLDNWEQVKSKIDTMVDESNFMRNPDQDFLSDRGTSEYYMEDMVDIIKPIVTDFVTEIHAKKADVFNLWTVKYNKHDYHAVHNHGQSGYTAVLYYEYDKIEHTPTYFLDPLPDPLGTGTRFSSVDVKEGDIVIVPSSILHYTKPNTSDKPRKVISWDMVVTR